MFLHFQWYVSFCIYISAEFSYIILCFVGKIERICVEVDLWYLKIDREVLQNPKLTHMLTQGLITELYVQT